MLKRIFRKREIAVLDGPIFSVYGVVHPMHMHRPETQVPERQGYRTIVFRKTKARRFTVVDGGRLWGEILLDPRTRTLIEEDGERKFLAVGDLQEGRYTFCSPPVPGAASTAAPWLLDLAGIYGIEARNSLPSLLQLAYDQGVPIERVGGRYSIPHREEVARLLGGICLLYGYEMEILQHRIIVDVDAEWHKRKLTLSHIALTESGYYYGIEWGNHRIWSSVGLCLVGLKEERNTHAMR